MALTTLTRIKEYLGITGSAQDDKLTNLLNAASLAIPKYCDRELESASRTELHSGVRDRKYLTLNAYPVTAAPKVYFAYGCLDIRNTDSSTYEAFVSNDGTTLTLTRNGSDSTLTLASYATVTALAAAVTALGNGWTASATNGYGGFPATRLRSTDGTLDAKDGTAELALWSIAPHRNWCEYETGTLWGTYFPCGLRNVKVVYDGGYATIPDDLQHACSALVASLYRLTSRETGGTLKREKLGDYEYENFPVTDASAVSTNLSAISMDAAQLLAPYRRPRAL